MMQKLPDFSAEQMKKIAESDAGKQLLALLQQSQGENLKNAMDLAAAGDYSKAKDILSTMMQSPQAAALLKQLRGQQNG